MQQGFVESQYTLGLIYAECKYIKKDINKAIYYYTLAANQNEYKVIDINKAIHYYTLAANQNLPYAQQNLGDIYYSGKYVPKDINRAIYYYSLAANQNSIESINELGYIYYSGTGPKKHIDFRYKRITSKELNEKRTAKQIKKSGKDITSDFYEGFGLDI